MHNPSPYKLCVGGEVVPTRERACVFTFKGSFRRELAGALCPAIALLPAERSLWPCLTYTSHGNCQTSQDDSEERAALRNS